MQVVSSRVCYKSSVRVHLQFPYSAVTNWPIEQVSLSRVHSKDTAPYISRSLPPPPPHTQPPIQIFWGSVEEELVVYSFVFSLATDFKDVCVQLVFLKKESHPCCLCDFTFIFLFFFLSSFPSYFHLDSSWFHFFSFSYCFVFMWGFFFFYFYLFLLLILFLTDLFLEHYAGNSLMDLQLSCA